MSHVLRLTVALILSLLPSVVASAEDGEFLFILNGRGNVFWKVLREGVEDTSQELGVKAVVLHTDDDQTPEAQLAMCETALARKPKVVVMGAATKAVGIQCFRKAIKAGVIPADVDGNVTVEDAKAAGIVEGVKVAGRTDSVKVVSVDGTKDARNALMTGRMAANIAQLTYLMGKRSVELALQAARGSLHGYTEFTPTPTLTKELLENNKDPILQYLR